MVEVKVLQDFRTLKAGQAVDCSAPVTVLVGRNGCGKSTLIELVRSILLPGPYRRQHWQSVTISREDAVKIIRLRFARGQTLYGAWGFDAERDNLHVPSPVLHGDGLLQAISIQGSHGQASRLRLAPLLDGDPPKEACLFLLDEPESGLDLASTYKLIRAVRRFAAAGSRFVLSTHHPALITGRIPNDPHPGWPSVWNVETMAAMEPDAYLASQAGSP